MKPLGNRLLLRAPAAPDRVGTLYIPPSAQQDFVLCQAEVLERGDGVRDWRLQPGARVVVKRFGRVTLNDDVFAIQEEQVLALIDTEGL